MRFVAELSGRLDRILANALPHHSRTKLAELIVAGGVRVDGVVLKPGSKVSVGSTIEVMALPKPVMPDLQSVKMDLDVPYEDEHLMVVVKPRGLATHPAPSLRQPSLVNALLGRGGDLSGTAGSFRPGIVHRLDKETSGLLVVAKSDQVHASLARQIALKQAERRYFAFVSGSPPASRFIVDAPISRSNRNRLRMTVDSKGRAARTHFKVIRETDGGALLAARLETGRTHQIRVHLLSVNLLVQGDRLYGSNCESPMMLHAAYLSFTHPVSNEVVLVFVPPPVPFTAAAWATKSSLDPF